MPIPRLLCLLNSFLQDSAQISAPRFYSNNGGIKAGGGVLNADLRFQMVADCCVLQGGGLRGMESSKAKASTGKPGRRLLEEPGER